MASQESTGKSGRTYQWIDVFKFIFCICIIAMHANLPLPGVYWIEKLVFRLAVPFFFAASGFFLSKSCRERGVGIAVKRYCLRLLQLLLVFSAIWILQFWIDCFLNKTRVLDALLQTAQHIVFFPRNALWFIQACIVGALLLIPFFQRDRIPWAVLIGLILYGFALLCNNDYFLAEKTAVRPVIDGYLKLFLAPHNGVFVGFVYLAVGAFAERYLGKMPMAALWLLLSACYGAYAAEIILVQKNATFTDDGAFYLMQIAVAPLLLSALARLPGQLNPEHTVLMRRLSTGMYLLHLPLMWCYHRFCDRLLPLIPVLKRGHGILMNGYVKFAVVFVLSWAICMLAYRYTKNLKRFLM